MNRGRNGRKRWIRLTTALASLAAAPFLYSSCGGGGGGGAPPAPTFGTVVIAGGSVGPLGSAQPTHTPDSVTLTIQDASISTDDGTILSTLTADITATDTTIPVISTTGFAASGIIHIENEDISYAGVETTAAACSPFSPPCFTGATRGVNGTSAASHSSRTSVTEDKNYISIPIDSTTGGVVNVVANPGGKFAESEQNSIPSGDYKAIHLTITGISWHATWSPATSSSPANSSPCDGATSGTAGPFDVDLGGPTDFYFKTPDLGGNTLAFYQAHPPLSGYIGDTDHPFVLASPIKVVANTTTTVNLILGIGNTLTCNALGIYAPGTGTPLRTISGDSTGDKTGLNSPIGTYVYVDTNKKINEIGVANSGNDSVTIYDGAADGNVKWKYIVRGANTGLSRPTGIYIDTVNDEIGVVNSGNDSITVYDRTTVINSGSNGNVLPKRAPISGYFTGLSRPTGIYVDTTNNEIGVANSGVLILLGTSTGNNTSTTLIDTNQSFPNQVINSLVRITSGTGEGQVRRITNNTPSNTLTVSQSWTTIPDNTSTYQILIPNNSSITIYDRLSFLDTAPLQTILPASGTACGDSATTKMDLCSPGGVFLDETADPDGNPLNGTGVLYVANTGANSILVFDNASTANGNAVPDRTIAGALTTLDSPSGIFVDTVNNLLYVANTGANSILVFDNASTVSGDIAPRPITGLNSPMGLYVDTTNTEIGVTNNGQQVVMASLPSIFPSSTNNANPSTWLLSGDYNLIFYGAAIDHTTPGGISVPRFFAERGVTASFDPSTASFSFGLDKKITRRIGDTTGSVQSSSAAPTNCDLDNSSSGFITTGTYGVNTDGSFYAIIGSHNGTLQGTVKADGSAFVASTYDSSDKLMLVYGVQASNNPPFLTSDGTFSLDTTDYLFASYRSVYTYNYNFDPTIKQRRILDILQYQVAVGIAETGASTPPPTAYITGVSGDANLVEITNPTGFFSSPAGGPVYRQGFINLPLQDYFSYPTGLLENPSDGLAGALTSDGSTWIVARNTQRCDDLGFGVGLRVSPAGSFGTGSLNGTYFTAAFGDSFDATTRTSHIRSTGGTIAFDGAGNATLTLAENQEGMLSLSSINQIKNLTYRVSQRFVPNAGSPAVNVDVVDIFMPGSPDPIASALIGPERQSLIFFFNMYLRSTGTYNPTRLLGLALLQTPSP